MLLLNLILILLIGGAIAWWSERLGTHLPRLIAVFVVLIDLAYLLNYLAGIPLEQLSVVPDAADPSSWLLAYQLDWIPRFGISFQLAMDGLSLVLILLTLVLGVIAIISSWNEKNDRQGFFQANILWTLAGVIGVFLAMDLFLFFLFWEVMLVPMYLLIAIWGHEGKAYASMKFFIFTQFSGLLMLLAILVLAILHHNATGIYSFSYFDLLATPIESGMAHWLMLGFFIAFVVKLPGFPFHTWLPDAHTQAPTAGSVILAGILLKTGAYGLIRFTVPLFPEAALDFAPTAMFLGVAGVIYGAVLAFSQSDFKRLVAYSSVSHMGFVLLGVFAWNSLALQGAVMQMVAHGFSTAALFMIAGALQQRLHTRDMSKMGGLWHHMPRMGAVALFFALASLGMPGVGNFVAEFLVLLGLFAVNPWMTAAAALGLITAAVYSLIMMQRAFYGKPDTDLVVTDFAWLEMTAMAIMIVALVWLGLYPQPVFDMVQPVLDSLSNVVSSTSAAVGAQ
ncbi:MAG TPA: NADH-quinone oxidoreductase subunit M [Gammaproteobacteria bacterium]|jgi:NADH-quinone oxidoreductase subunit M|nr:NADH-quinone oxidoreductase subunit M [Gammaproteobacteria bacterium]